MIAIRCRVPGRSFRRDGILFSGNEWTFVDDATPAQLAEPMLLCVEVDGEDDPRLSEALKPVKVLAVLDTHPDETGLRAVLISLEAENADLHIVQETLQGQVDSYQSSLREAMAQLRAAEESQETLAEQVRILEQTNAELGQERDALQEATERDLSTGDVEAPSEPAVEPNPAPEASPEASAPRNRGNRA